MGIRLPEVMLHAKQIMRSRRSHSKQHCSYQTSSVNVPKGHFAVYVGDEERSKRFVVPISYLKHPLFQALLSQAEEEFGFDCPVRGLMVPCAEDEFINLTSRINHEY
ncbi:Auxin responsive SAUR protein [Corchorus olitorius]|uniref:Auxin responsive SAUR protein n=1 Tax=Corchorus olitorius TaxID=93759 RepID=A0A1R3JDK7_9ROSI|nr:Auxin responsive SAUR protein [Corchorus olitorius]